MNNRQVYSKLEKTLLEEIAPVHNFQLEDGYYANNILRFNIASRTNYVPSLHQPCLSFNIRHHFAHNNTPH